jgi:protein-S-isoprenylcysteine O-methyltransferase Ste14
MAFKAAPLNSAFMVTAILGIIFSVFYVPTYSPSWAFAFGLLFLCMLIASFISMTRATPDAQLYPIPRKHK